MYWPLTPEAGDRGLGFSSTFFLAGCLPWEWVPYCFPVGWKLFSMSAVAQNIPFITLGMFHVYFLSCHRIKCTFSLYICFLHDFPVCVLCPFVYQHLAVSLIWLKCFYIIYINCLIVGADIFLVWCPFHFGFIMLPSTEDINAYIFESVNLPSSVIASRAEEVILLP